MSPTDTIVVMNQHLYRKAKATYFMEVLSTPLCGVFSRMAVENGKITLTTYISKVCDKSVCVLHGASLTLVLGYANAIRHGDRWKLIQGLEVAERH
jgi:hypothetical protein